MPFEIKVILTSISETDLKSNCCVSQRLFMPEWKALNVGVESEDVAQQAWIQDFEMGVIFCNNVIDPINI